MAEKYSIAGVRTRHLGNTLHSMTHYVSAANGQKQDFGLSQTIPTRCMFCSVGRLFSCSVQKGGRRDGYRWEKRNSYRNMELGISLEMSSELAKRLCMGQSLEACPNHEPAEIIIKQICTNLDET